MLDSVRRKPRTGGEIVRANAADRNGRSDERRRGRDEAVLITSARRSRSEEIAARQRRYLLTMGLRLVMFLLALALLRGPWQWIGIAAAVVLPWVAVIVANGGEPKPRQKPSFYTRTRRAIGPGSGACRDLPGG